MITSFRPRNFKGLNAPPLFFGATNLVIGPNNCGKSTLFSAISFLFDLFGKPEDSKGTLQAALRARASSPIATRGEVNQAVGLEWDFDLNEYEYGLTLLARPDQDVTIERESVNGRVQDSDVFSAVFNRGKIEWKLTRSADGALTHVGPLPVEFRTQKDSHLDGKFAVWANTPTALVPAPSQLAEIRAGLESIAAHSTHVSFANFVPADIALPQKEQPGVHTFDGRGLNLVNLLFELMKVEGFAARLQTELEPLLPGMEGFYIHEGGGQRWIRVKIHGKWVDLAELSDGTVKMIALATMLFSPEKGVTLCLDEPELNLHPAWARIAAGWIARQTAWEQVLVSTHSPEILDPFTDMFRQGAVNLFSFEKTERGFSVRPVPPEILEAQLKEGWLLGDLYRVGEPAMGGWPW